MVRRLLVLQNTLTVVKMRQAMEVVLAVVAARVAVQLTMFSVPAAPISSL